MSSLGIDFRDGFLRILVTTDSTVKYSRIVKDFSLINLKSAQETLTSLIKEAGGSRGKSSVILPDDIIHHRTFQIPAMEPEDAQRYIRREITKELKGQNFTFGIRRLLPGKKEPSSGQSILAEYVLSAEANTYLNFLRSCGIKSSVMTSGLEGTLHMFSKFRPETAGNEAVLDIGMNMIEITVFNNGRLLEHIQLPISLISDEETVSTADQSDKIKTYRIMDTLYKFIMAYNKDLPDEKLSVLWICGIGSMIEGLTNSLSEGLGIECKLINPFDREVQDASVFAPLKGIMELSRQDTFINLIPAYVLTARKKLLRRTLVAAALSFYVLLLIGGAIILNRTEKDLNEMFEKLKTYEALRINQHKAENVYSAGREAFAKLILNNRPMYNIFRDIAELTPSEVMLTDIQVEKPQDVTTLKITAKIQYNDDNFKNAVMSKFITSLDRSSSMKRTSNPEITIPKTTNTYKEIIVKTTYEVIR